MRGQNPDYLDFDGENDDIIFRLIQLWSNFNDSNDEIENRLNQLRAVNPDYLKWDSENDDLINRFVALTSDEEEDEEPVKTSKYRPPIICLKKTRLLMSRI